VLTSSDRALIDQAYTFLTRQLIPHAQAEEKALYPVVQRVMGSEQGTATMSRDHAEIEQLTLELGLLRSKLAETKITEKQANALRSVLLSPCDCEIAFCQRRGSFPSIARFPLEARRGTGHVYGDGNGGKRGKGSLEGTLIRSIAWQVKS
jgi:hypothetical protein